MMNITIGQYYPGNSVIHRLDPRTKIICTLIFITAVILAKTYVAYALLAGFVGLIIINFLYAVMKLSYSEASYDNSSPSASSIICSYVFSVFL